MNVSVSYDNVMVEIEDRESPLGRYDILDPQISQWLYSHCGDNWDYDFLTKKNFCDIVKFTILDSEIALLFKLTWG